MMSFSEQYRVFEHPSLVYFAGEQVASATELFHGEGKEEMGFYVEGMKPEDAGVKLRELYGPEKFGQALRDYVDQIYPEKGNPNIKEKLIVKPIANYTNLFNHENGIYAAFMRAVEDLEEAHDTAISAIEEEAKQALDELHEAVEQAREMSEKTPEPADVPAYPADRMSQVPILGPINDGKLPIPILTPFLSSMNIPILSPLLHGFDTARYEQAHDESNEKFTDYLAAMFETYMTPDAYESDLGKQFRAGIYLQVKGKIDFLFYEGKASKTALVELRQEIEGRLNEYASLDGKPGDLSLEDLGRLRAQTPPLDEELLNLAEAGTSEEILKALEARHALSPEDWLTATTKATEDSIAEAVRNNNQQGLVDAVNAYGKKNDPDFESFTDFGPAQDYFRQVMGYRALAGVRETMETLEEINIAINGERAGLFDDVPDALKGMVVKERDNLIREITIPVPGSYDEVIVQFMRENSREARETMLKDEAQRQRLFQAIRIIEEDYGKYYDDQAQNLPEKASELSTARDPSKPTGHDVLARTKAVMILAKETRWIVENFDRDLNLGLKNELKETKIIRRGENDVYKPNVTFRHVNALYHVGYVTTAARSGFTFKNMGLTALKVWGGVTAFANFASSFKEAHGLKHWDKAVEAAISNPFIYAGAGIVYGVNRLQENPKALRAITGSPGERDEVTAHARLDSLGRRLGIAPLEEFIRTESEWSVMRHLKPEQIKALMETVRTRNPKHPQIIKEDLQELVPPEDWVHLPNDEAGQGNATRRFYFYSKFLTSETNIPQLREHCNSWL